LESVKDTTFIVYYEGEDIGVRYTMNGVEQDNKIDIASFLFKAKDNRIYIIGPTVSEGLINEGYTETCS
jgi:hypothetical protein